MKSMTTQLLLFLRQRPSRRNIFVLLRFVAVLIAMVVLFSVIFHYLMAYEENLGIPEREHSWVTGLYWTLTVMSTLGFGDITFESDLGRAFSIVVLLSGTLFLLVLLPFTFIQFFYAPWTEAQAEARTPRRLPEGTTGHVVLTTRDAISFDLIRRFEQFGQEYALVVPDADVARALHDEGRRTMIGDLDTVDTYTAARAKVASVVVALGDDVYNANAVFLARQAAPDTPVVCTANTAAAGAIQKLAGATEVLRLGELMGENLARRTIGGDAVTHVVGSLGPLLIAEANASRTPLVGKTLRENRLRDLGPTVLGLWDRGKFELASPDLVVGERAVLLLAGTRQQLDAYDEAFVIYNVSGEPVVLIGAGRVGHATARSLRERGIESNMVELHGDVPDQGDFTEFHVGDAADPEVLSKAGIDTAAAALVTTSDDAMNIYLTIQIRHLRPDIQIVARAERDRSVDVLHRAGADAVLSMASVGVSRILKFVDSADVLPVAEGLNVTRIPAPPSLVGRTIGDLNVRERAGVTIVAVATREDLHVNPAPDLTITADSDIWIIGDDESEQRFFATYGSASRAMNDRQIAVPGSAGTVIE